jgi:G:T-mismatch repair DNA endonuclease (very short patch repair protein)
LHDNAVRNWREYRLPELPCLSVDGFCRDIKTVYEFFACYFHGHTCLHYRDIATMGGDTFAKRYELTMARFEQITNDGYQVKMKWECEFDMEIWPLHLELNNQPLVSRVL